ncbi:MAG: glycosyl hydrolase 2 galactose-binding domain-containing protein [Cytophagaceae bacterium]
MKKFFQSSLFLLAVSCFLYSCTGNVSEKKIRPLSQGWEFSKAGSKEWLPAQVPGNVHMDLLRNKKIEDPFYGTNEKSLQWIEKENWEYRTTFTISPEELKNENVFLVFKGLDTYAEVLLNDKPVLNAFNMFREWRADVKKELKEGANSLKIIFTSPINKVMPEYEALGFQYPANNDQSDKKVSIFTRKAGYHYGWDWGPRFVTSGIWRPVFLETWNKARINNVQLVTQSISQEKAEVKALVEIESTSDQKIKLNISGMDASVKEEILEADVKAGINKVELTLTISKPEKWWPAGLGSQKLYPIKTELFSGKQKIDSDAQKIGLRTVQLVRQKDAQGESFYFNVNDVPVFMKGANYIPSDNFQNRIDEKKYRMLVQSAVDANMNMLRVWGGGIYEDDKFYELCDEKGIMLWQDFMFGCSMYPADSARLDNIKQEAIGNVKRLRNHPSLAMWCGNNEMETAWLHWGWQKNFGWTQEQQDNMWADYQKIFHTLLPQICNEYDPARFYHRSSPSANNDSIEPDVIGFGDKHYWGVWHAEEPYTAYKKNISRFMSEYGFQSFPELKTVMSYAPEKDWNIESEVMLHHQRHPRGNPLIREYMFRDYRKPKDFPSFLYTGQVLQAEIIKYAAESHRRAKPYCMGSLYWQLDDCWPVASWSGMDYYGRWKALHYFARKFYSPVLVSLDEDSGKVNSWIVSDRLDELKGKLFLKLMDFSGKILWSDSMDLSVPANSSKTYFSLERNQLLKNRKAPDVVLIAELKSGTTLISSNTLYFTQPKNLNLPKAALKTKIDQGMAGGDFYITIKADKLAKNVYLSDLLTEGFFSDNYFDLLPGEEKVVVFTPARPAVSQAEFEALKKSLQKNLNIISLVDSY